LVFSLCIEAGPSGAAIMSPMPITNLASMVMHENSTLFPAYLGWILKERNVPVAMDGCGDENTYYLVTDWFVMVYDLEIARAMDEARRRTPEIVA
jgi:hypothetical protein